MRFRGTLFERLGTHGARVESTFDVPWGEAESVFPLVVGENKEAQQLWASAEYQIGANRGNAGLNVVHAALLDKDCGDIGELDALCSWLDTYGLAYCVYSSWSHRDAHKVHKDTGIRGPFDCFRVVLPYSRDVTPAEHAVIVPALFGHEVPEDKLQYALEVMGRYVPRANGTERAARPRGWDPASSRPSQGWFVPGCPPERAHEAVFEVRSGRPLDVEAVLARPQTAKPTMRRLRPHQAATQAGVGLLGKALRALGRLKFWVGPQGHEGWHRSACPSCAPDGNQKSPSFVVRANGDGVDLRCYSGCSRAELLQALGLDREEFKEPTQARLLVEEQLARQLPKSDDVSVDEAVVRLEKDLEEALRSRQPTILKYPAGVGKSHASAKVMSMLVREGWRIGYSTQEHLVAHETRSKLDTYTKARSVHAHSPLLKVGDDPVCRRADELKERVFEYGLSLLGQVCPRCPHKDDCAALAEARARTAYKDEASVVFLSHAGIAQAFGLTPEGEVKGADMALIVDEMPGVYERVGVSPEDLRLLGGGAALISVDPLLAKAVAEMARAWLGKRAPCDVSWGIAGESLGNAREIVREWSRVVLRDSAHPSSTERRALQAADALVRLCAFEDSGGSLCGLEWPEDEGVWAMLPDACAEALKARSGVLLSATPLIQALPGFAVRECAVKDGARVRRVMVVRDQRGSKAVTSSYWDAERGERRRRHREPEEGPGIPWPAVDRALERALLEADCYSPNAKVLFVTFKALADRLREMPWRTKGRVEIAHFGAVRGKNDWMEGREKECQVVYLFGSPRFDLKPTLAQLRLFGEAADQAWVDFAAGELTQAEGRLRLPRRTKPCTVFCEGDVAPSTWHSENVDDWIDEDEGPPPVSELLEMACWWHGVRAVEDKLGSLGDIGEKPVENLGILRELANPDPGELSALYWRWPRAQQVSFWDDLQSALDEGVEACQD